LPFLSHQRCGTECFVEAEEEENSVMLAECIAWYFDGALTDDPPACARSDTSDARDTIASAAVIVTRLLHIVSSIGFEQVSTLPLWGLIAPMANMIRNLELRKN
jgi:hypothetical protein